MMNIKKAAAVGITAFAMTALLPSSVSASNVNSIIKIKEAKNVLSVNKACSLDELKESLTQIAINGDCFKWGIIIGGNNNIKPDGDKGESDSNKPNDDIENDTEDKEDNNTGEEDKIPDEDIKDEDISDNESNKPNTKPEDNNEQKPVFPETDEEESVSSYAQQVVHLVNIERAKEGLNTLTFSQSIGKAAAIRAKEIQTSFSHTRPNGSHFATALKEAGVSYRGTGENIAWGQKTPEEVVKAWMNSPGHRANIMNPNFKNIGVGYELNRNKTPYWVQLFTY